MEIITVTSEGKGTAIKIADAVFGQKYNETLVHQVVTAYQAGARSGNQAQKTRAEVSGGGKKPWRQKGTGRARAGSSRSPIWRGGGITFAAKPRDYSQKVNKKMYRGALRVILSELVRQNRLLVVENLTLESHKTRDLLAKLKGLHIEAPVLIICEEIDKNLYLASRNIYQVNVRDFMGVDPVSLIKFDKVLMTVGVVKKFEEVLG